MTRSKKTATSLLLLLGAAIAALALSACGDSEETTVTETTTTTASDTSGDASGAGTDTGTSTDGAPPPADITVDDSATFVSPSENIACFIDKTSVRCDIAERDWKPPAAPADCQLDYGQGVSLNAGGSAELVCAGDTVLGSGGQTLEYGQAISAGLLRCESTEQAMTCTDTESGRGFSLSREGYELF